MRHTPAPARIARHSTTLLLGTRASFGTRVAALAPTPASLRPSVAQGFWYSDDFYGPHGREWVQV